MRHKIKAIFYDLDNTVYSQTTDVAQRIDYCIKLFGFKNGDNIREFWLKEWSENGPLKRDLIEEVVKKFSLKIDKERVISAYRACPVELSLNADTRSLLSYIRKKDIKQFLITNGRREMQISKLVSLGLEEFFDKIIVADGRHPKPSGYWFEKTLKKYKLDPKECLSVGDWYAVDGLASVSSGISFLHVGGGPINEKIPSYINRVAKLSNIKRYLDTGVEVDFKRDFEFEDVFMSNFINLTPGQKELVKRCRNHGVIRKWMYSDHIITSEEHDKFLKSLKSDSKNFYWLVRNNYGKYLGVVYINKVSLRHKAAYLGIYSNPYSKIKGKRRLLIESLFKVCFYYAGFHTLKLEVLESNVRAINFYNNSGFKKEGTLKEFVHKNGKFENIFIMGILNKRRTQRYKKGRE